MRARTAVGLLVVLLSLMSTSRVDACGLGWFLCHVCHHRHCWCYDCSASGSSSTPSGGGRDDGARARDRDADAKAGAERTQRQAQLEQATGKLDVMLRQFGVDPNTVGAGTAGGDASGARSFPAGSAAEGDRAVAEVIAVASAIPKIIEAIARLKEDIDALKKAKGVQNADPNDAGAIPKIVEAIALLAQEVQALKSANETRADLRKVDPMVTLAREVALLKQEVSSLKTVRSAVKAAVSKKLEVPKKAAAPAKPLKPPKKN